MYTCRFFPGWVVNSLFLMATRRSFLSSAISAPGYKCPPWTSGVRIPPKGCGMCLRFCLFTSCTTPTLIGWIWHKFRGGGWNIVYCLRLSRSKNTGFIEFRFMCIISYLIKIHLSESLFVQIHGVSICNVEASFRDFVDELDLISSHNEYSSSCVNV